MCCEKLGGSDELAYILEGRSIATSQLREVR